MSKKRSKKSSTTDWKRVDGVRDTDVDTSEIAPLDESFFENAELRLPGAKQSITVRLDSDVLEWFRSQGKGYQTRINAVLRFYMESQKNGPA
ncbi:MAG: BrnA antitoxin family protein [Woeseia sp.]|nr:BrnA antitoxin family protein [Woeseia sp.]